MILSPILDAFNTDASKGWLDARPWCHLRLVPFVLIHLGAVAAFFVGVSPIALTVALGLYLLRMFAITAFYHRYFSHRSFRTGRILQFVGGFIGNCAAQRGPLWWAAHHREHHRHSDVAGDTHSPVVDSLWHAHVGWIGDPNNYHTKHQLIRDWQKYPELLWLNRFDSLPPIFLAGACFAVGAALAQWYPQLGTNGLQMLLWGFCVSTVACYHITFCINSVAHRWGRQTFATKDQSRNNPTLALLTLGEGWHNNHHRFASSARQGFYWWQLDISYLVLRFLAACGLVWDLRPVPQHILDEGRRPQGAAE